MENQEFKELFDQAINNYANRNMFDVAKIPYHHHDGVDSVQISFENLVSSKNYVGIANVTLSSTQIKALKDTPIIIVPLQTTGSTTPSTSIGTVIIVEGITAKIIYNGTAYTGANNLEFRYTGVSGTKVTADIANTFINTAGSAYAHVAGIVTAFTPVPNTPIVVCVPTANPGTGNSTIQLIIKYRLVNL